MELKEIGRCFSPQSRVMTNQTGPNRHRYRYMPHGTNLQQHPMSVASSVTAQRLARSQQRHAGTAFAPQQGGRALSASFRAASGGDCENFVSRVAASCGPAVVKILTEREQVEPELDVAEFLESLFGGGGDVFIGPDGIYFGEVSIRLPFAVRPRRVGDGETERRCGERRAPASGRSTSRWSRSCESPRRLVRPRKVFSGRLSCRKRRGVLSKRKIEKRNKNRYIYQSSFDYPSARRRRRTAQASNAN